MTSAGWFPRSEAWRWRSFLSLPAGGVARDGEAEPNLMWKDTVLVRTAEVVDILLDVTTPGVWRAHCHIAEHHESGMMLNFNVAPAGDA
jgi:FtsP/CotA-like multicopper oxidase with cupredoxin domain